MYRQKTFTIKHFSKIVSLSEQRTAGWPERKERSPPI